MGLLFSRKRPSRVTKQDEAILQLKTQRDKLKQYHKRIELNLDKERQTAVQLLKNGKKERAMLLLRRKRYLEQLQERSVQQLENIERMVHDIEFTQIEMRVMDGLKAGNACLAKMHEILTLDDVEKIMSETQEAVEYQKEIDAALAGCLSIADEAELEKELEEMSKADAEELKLPEVPSGLPVVEKELSGTTSSGAKAKKEKTVVAA